MKKIIYMLSIFLLTQNSMAYESGQLSLDTPNVLEKNRGSFSIRHRFFGEYSDTEKFLGTDDGGNIYFSLKYAFLDNLVLGVDHTRDENGYGIGLEYAKKFDFASFSLRLNGFQINAIGFEEKQKSYFINGAIQTPNYFDHMIFTANLGYDAFYKHNTLGFGIDLNVNNFIPFFTFTEKLSLLGEYYPKSNTIDGITGKYNSYAFGIKFKTFAHHFEILLSNSTNMDSRTMALGTNSKELHFGFNINRKF